MVINPPIRSLIIGVAISLCAHAEAGDFLAASSYHRKTVRSVIIDVNQSINKGSSATPGEEDCSKFKVSEHDVVRYFKNARAIDDMHDYQYGGCSAEGKVFYTDGSHAKWKIVSSRIGLLILPNENAYFMFCRYEACREKIYDRFAGMNSDSEWAAEEERLENSRKRKRRAQTKTAPR